MRTEAEIRKHMEKNELREGFRMALEWVLNEPEPKFKVGDKVLMNYMPGVDHDWKGVGTVTAIRPVPYGRVGYDVVVPGACNGVPGMFDEREILPIPAPPKGVLLFPKGYVATWEAFTASYRVNGGEECYGDWHDLLETYGYDYEVLKESV